jgi:hypothetical protein
LDEGRPIARRDGNEALTRVRTDADQPPAVFVDGVAVITDEDLASKLLERGIARLTP